jgi:hypothetical protein
MWRKCNLSAWRSSRAGVSITGRLLNEEAEVCHKRKEFYEYLSAAPFGPAFAAGLVPDLAKLIPDEVKKIVLLKCAGIDYVSPITATALFAKPQDEDVKPTPEEEASCTQGKRRGESGSGSRSTRCIEA